MADSGETPAEQQDGDAPPKKTPSRKSKGKSKKNIPQSDEPPKEPAPEISPITHEPVVMADSAMPPQPTPSVGQLEQKPRVRDFWVCWGMLFLFALACGIGFAILHTSKFSKGEEKWRLMQAVREMGTHGTIMDGQKPSSSPTPSESTTANTTK